jgi:hypothetical protein
VAGNAGGWGSERGSERGLREEVSEPVTGRCAYAHWHRRDCPRPVGGVRAEQQLPAVGIQCRKSVAIEGRKWQVVKGLQGWVKREWGGGGGDGCKENVILC